MTELTFPPLLAPPPPDITGIMRWRGVWADGEYLTGDAVLDSNVLYVAVADNASDPPAAESGAWDRIDHSIPMIHDADHDPVFARYVDFIGATVDTTNAPSVVAVTYGKPTASQVAQAIGKAKAMQQIALPGSLTFVEGFAKPQVGMDIGGMVRMAGRVHPTATGAVTLTTLADDVLLPEGSMKRLVATEAGGVMAVTVQASGAIQMSVTSAADFYLDGLAWPSAVAFADPTSKELVFNAPASQDPARPLQVYGETVVGAFRGVQGGTVGFADGTEIAEDKHWHWSGSGTWTVVSGTNLGTTGAFTVSSNDELELSFVTPPDTTGQVRYVMAPGSTVEAVS